jgi:hypothetical protein
VTLRVIAGGRYAGTTPGLLIHGAAQIATLAGGLRRGPAQDDVAILSSPEADGGAGRDAPVVACWQGSILAVGGG